MEAMSADVGRRESVKSRSAILLQCATSASRRNHLKLPRRAGPRCRTRERFIVARSLPGSNNPRSTWMPVACSSNSNEKFVCESRIVAPQGPATRPASTGLKPTVMRPAESEPRSQGFHPVVFSTWSRSNCVKTHSASFRRRKTCNRWWENAKLE